MTKSNPTVLGAHERTSIKATSQWAHGWTALKLLLLTLAAVVVQGYHLGTDDGEIYLPTIKQVINPHLYPFGADFFLMHGRLSHLALIVGGSARLLHLSADPAIFLWHIIGVFLLMLAGWRMAHCLFTNERAAWGAVAVLALTMSVSVAGTALVIADPYLTARSLSTPLSLMAVASFLRGGKASVVFWLLLTALVHPQMVVYAVGFLLFLLLPVKWVREQITATVRMGFAGVLSSQSAANSFSLHPATGDYHDVLYMRTFFFLSMWHWDEWVGVIAPLTILYGLTRLQLRGITATFRRVCRALIAFALFSTLAAILLSSSTRFDNLARLQPMRSFHMLYIIFFLILGGLLTEYVLQARVWRWLLFFISLSGGMFGLNKTLYPNSPHLEIPGLKETNPWLASFYWIRANTPETALFALDPMYARLPGEDEHGFRSIAERSRLADYYKDSGAATMFPQLVPEWKKEQDAQNDWKHFSKEDFERLHDEFGVTWVVLNHPVKDVTCPYSNESIRVCRID